VAFSKITGTFAFVHEGHKGAHPDKGQKAAAMSPLDRDPRKVGKQIPREVVKKGVVRRATSRRRAGRELISKRRAASRNHVAGLRLGIVEVRVS